MLSIKQSGQMEYIEFDQIISIETVLDRSAHNLKLTGHSRRIVFFGYLKHVMEKLDERFYYLSQSCIIILQNVNSLNILTRDITMSNGEKFIVPMKKMKEVRRLLSDL